MYGERWTKEQTAYLQRHYGEKSLTQIADHIGKSVAAVRMKRRCMHMPAFLKAGEYVTYNELIKAVTGSQAGDTYTTISWIKNRGFPVHYQRVENNRFRVVYLNEFWAWAEKNRAFIDFSKMEEKILGAEPAWVKEKRRIDIKARKYKKTPWTAEEDSRLLSLLRQYKYGYAELSTMLGRTAGAIQRHICDLNLRERPVRMSPHGKWETDQIACMNEMMMKGMPYSIMAEKIGKSEKAIRGYAFRSYGTENIDKIRRMIEGETA